LGIYIYSWFASQAVEYGVNAFCIHIYRYARESRIGIKIAINQTFFTFKFQPHDTIHVLNFSSISQIISHRFQSCFLSYRIINHNHKKRIRLTIQYNNQIHNKICTSITKLQNQIQKLKKISCQRNWLNFTNFLSIQLQIAENQRTKYVHKHTRSMVLNTVIIFQNHIGSHLILLCIKPKIHAQTMNRIIRFLIFSLELAKKYAIGNAEAHNKAEITTHRFCHEDNIQK